jgi:hypothetical protein
MAALSSNESYGLDDAPRWDRRPGVSGHQGRRDRFNLGRWRTARHRNGDVESSGFGGARAVKTFASAQRLVLGVGRE